MEPAYINIKKIPIKKNITRQGTVWSRHETVGNQQMNDEPRQQDTHTHTIIIKYQTDSLSTGR